MIRTLSAAAVAVIFAGALTGAADARSHARVHTVAAGETLAEIAAREHVSLNDLTRINEIAATTAVEPAPSLRSKRRMQVLRRAISTFAIAPRPAPSSRSSKSLP